jgi:hypothetical protein
LYHYINYEKFWASTYWLCFTAFGVTGISVRFTFISNTKTTIVKNFDMRKTLRLLNVFFMVLRVLNIMHFCVWNLFQIYNDLYKLTPFGTWYPARTMSLTDSLWFPIVIADNLQLNNENPTFHWELFCFSHNSTSPFKLYRTHIFIRKLINIQQFFQ